MKIYIAGPMAGYESHNWENFNKAEKLLKYKGHEVVNPAKLNGTYEEALKKTWSECLRNDIKHLLDCDAVYFLAGWQESKGATLEYIIAGRLGMLLFFEGSEKTL